MFYLRKIRVSLVIKWWKEGQGQSSDFELQNAGVSFVMFTSGLTTKSACLQILLLYLGLTHCHPHPVTHAMGLWPAALAPSTRGGRCKVSSTGPELLPSCFSSWFCKVFQALLPCPLFCPWHFLVSLVVTISSITYTLSHVADSFRRSNMKGTTNDGTYSPDYSLASVDLTSFKNSLVDIIQQNKERWKELAAQGTVYEAFLPSLSVLMPPLRCWIVFPPRFPLLQNMQALRGICNLAIHKKIDYS